ncbi:MAG: peptidase [Candidatus Komeilibacteria bacterium CG11_big_fil_rev_8_21_14_0_20_36_20]|uniref:Peptidase n=1 Tax=Candidatus Komeilibacteria bacterium CG11_big_fil_rev_8_21_14_0_20_36_20 TaxID=1974477 RepID=A0A2H0NCQ2_9BACT|nr:MAG: peptidase [Candidatus Komeilibacteria bacterium CG11_big_fil_rev_8_21_14_0_20_36_20]
MPLFSKKSKKNLIDTDYRLVNIAYKAIEIIDFSVIEGYRSETKQNKLFKEGFTKAQFPLSPHNKKPSRAIDLLPYPFQGWENKEQFFLLAGVIKAIAHEQNIGIRWGGEFKSFFDGPHFELLITEV